MIYNKHYCGQVFIGKFQETKRNLITQLADIFRDVAVEINVSFDTDDFTPAEV